MRDFEFLRQRASGGNALSCAHVTTRNHFAMASYISLCQDFAAFLSMAMTGEIPQGIFFISRKS